MAWCYLKGLVTKVMHAKYKCSIINTPEDMSQFKVFVTERRTDRGTNRRTTCVLMSPAFAKARETKTMVFLWKATSYVSPP